MNTNNEPLKIIEHFRLDPKKEYDFVNIYAHQDIPLFLDPYGISLIGTKLSQECEKQIVTFFQYLVDSLKNNDGRAVEKLLNALHEVNEIGLGYSEGEPRGRGIGKLQAEEIREAFQNSDAMRSGDIRDIADCALMIPGINRDKISDITANICKKQLVAFTEKQCEKWNIPTRRVAVDNAFDAETLRFESYYAKLPVINGHAKIFLPVTAVRRTPELSKEKFYRNFVLEYLRAEHEHAGDSLATMLRNGRVVVRIADLKEKYPLKENFLHQFTKAHPEILDKYKSELRRSALRRTTAHLNPEPRSLSAAERIDYLRKIPSGVAHADAFNKLTANNLEFIFEERLSGMQVERRINDGRKRIDITFDNTSKRGFFEQLHDRHRIFCPKIMVESKNYVEEISNPELDQLAGRFSKRRGYFGMLICRTVKDANTMLAKCRDYLKDQDGYILVLEDKHMIDLLKLAGDGDQAGVDQYMMNLLDKLIL